MRRRRHCPWSGGSKAPLGRRWHQATSPGAQRTAHNFICSECHTMGGGLAQNGRTMPMPFTRSTRRLKLQGHPPAPQRWLCGRCWVWRSQPTGVAHGGLPHRDWSMVHCVERHALGLETRLLSGNHLGKLKCWSVPWNVPGGKKMGPRGGTDWNPMIVSRRVLWHVL